MLARVSDITNKCYDGGQFTVAGFRKNSNVGAAQYWNDFSQMPGNPKPNYYVGSEREATLFDRNTINPERNGINGFFHGGPVAPATKHLHKFTIGTADLQCIGTYILCDFLMFYPFVDLDSTDEQPMTNPVTLPRYSDGVGVQAFFVSTTTNSGAQPTAIINYTNSVGTSGNSTKPHLSTGQLSAALIQSAGRNSPFFEIQQNDRGIRSIESITLSGPMGGLGAIVLVRPLATCIVSEQTATAEFDFLVDKPFLPRIYDGAYLNLIGFTNGTPSGRPFWGTITTIWN
jgi:hypothetical protein